MGWRSWFYALSFTLSLGCGSLFGQTGTADSVVEAPSELVSAHSNGLISRRSPIRLRLAVDAVDDAQVGKPTSSPFTFTPAIEGKAVWTSKNELEFTPSAELTPGATHRVHVDLHALLPTDPRATAFSFDVTVVQQAFFQTLQGLEADSEDGKQQRFVGSLKLADVADPPVVEAMLVAKHGKDGLKTTWTHSADGLEHRFVISGIKRKEDPSQLELTFKGSAVGVARDATENVTVPGLNQFLVSSIRAETSGDRYIELRFSDPLDAKQDLKGLITVADKTDIQLVREGSVVKIFSPGGGWAATEVVEVRGVRNAARYVLKEPYRQTVSFAPMVPAVSFSGKGVILPTTAEMTVPIEVTNVRAVHIEATRVYEQNVPQFLQVNDLGGDREMERVGQVIWSDRVEIEGAADRFNRPVQLGIDISELVKKNPAGLYHLSMRFEREDIVYDCGGAPIATPTVKEEPAAWDEPQNEHSFWDFWGDEGGYDAWERRDDPCHPAFYIKTYDRDITASRNIILTDVGLIASQGVGNEISAVATDLRTAEPISGAKLELLNYQLQPIGSGTTGADGRVQLTSAEERPFALVAHANGQTSWLRLDRGSSLQISHFDVGGVAVHKGLKGYIYGERGVWRPGDEIYLSFVLFDSAGKLPVHHPVEMELVNPRGQVIDRRTIPDSKNGFYRLTTRTPADAATGSWLVRVRAGGASFEKSLKIETVMPNRLKIGLDFGTKVIRGPEPALNSTLESRWLHGASAAGLNADIQVSLAPQATKFAKFDGYSFDDPATTFRADPTELWSGTIGEDGKVPVQATIPIPEGAPGLLTGTFATRVFEPGGAFSIDQATVTVSPHARYVGIKLPKGDAARNMLLTDVDHTVQVVAVDADGKPTGSGKIALSVQKISWRWWWEKGEDNLGQYAGSEAHTIVSEQMIDLKDGKGTWKFQVKYPEWGRYLVTARDVDGTHRTAQIVYMDWPGWAGRAQKDQPGGASVLSLAVDNAKAAVGQPVTVSFPVAKGGRALVSLESGSRVLSQAWVEPDPASPTAKYTFTPTANMAPNIYARVTMVQPHQSAVNDAPIRLYGVVPIDVFDPESKLQPQILTAAKFEPESVAVVKVSETKGRPMTYTLAVVDEGLLGLTRFQTPDPWANFNQREALGVRTWDLYDNVIGAYGGALEGLLSIGGDGGGLDGPQPQAQRFKPMVWYDGPFTLAPGQTAEHKVNIPQYVGEVRVMVVAGQDGSFGAAEKAVPVKKPLMVLATLPRVLSPGESVDLPVSVFALETSVKDVVLTVETEGPVTLNGERTKKLRFNAVGDQLATFRIDVGAVGVAKIRVKAEGGGQKAAQTIEIGVRNPGAPAVQTLASTVAPGKNWAGAPPLIGVAGSNEAWLEVSRTPPLTLAQHLDGLIQYPHGCVEQTTSSAFPQVYLSKLVDLNPAQAAATDAHVKAAISKLRSFQNAQGGFGYWAGAEVDGWSTSYVGHFLIESERAGYLLPQGMRSSWVSFQKERANRWIKDGPNSDLDQAYRLYTLALAGSPDIGAMNRLKESDLSNGARWRLASAYLLAGQKETAQTLIAKASTEVPPWRELTGTYGSDLRDRAMILETLVQMGDTARARPLAEAISGELSSQSALSTHETSYALIGLARYAGLSSGDWSMRWAVDGKPATEVKSGKPVMRIPVPVGATAPKLTVENPGSTPIYTRYIQKGILPLGSETPKSAGLSLDVKYTTLAGFPVELASVEHGADLVASITVTNTSGRPLNELALSWLAPSGWEISGLVTGQGQGYDYRDVRDDRVYTYFDLGAGQTTNFTIPVNASYSGHYYVPPVSVEAMYDASLRANNAGQWIDIGTLSAG